MRKRDESADEIGQDSVSIMAGAFIAIAADSSGHAFDILSNYRHVYFALATTPFITPGIFQYERAMRQPTDRRRVAIVSRAAEVKVADYGACSRSRHARVSEATAIMIILALTQMPSSSREDGVAMRW